MTPYETYMTSQYLRDLTILEERLRLAPETPWSPGRDGQPDKMVIRWDHADEPWLEYDASTLSRLPADENEPAWQRDLPFWAVLDLAESLDDNALLSAWDDARYVHHNTKEEWRCARAGFPVKEEDRPLIDKATWDAEQEAARSERRDGTHCRNEGYHVSGQLHHADVCQAEQDDPQDEASAASSAPCQIPEACEAWDCDGSGMSVQGWTDKRGYPEEQYAPCGRPCQRRTQDDPNEASA